MQGAAAGAAGTTALNAARSGTPPPGPATPCRIWPSARWPMARWPRWADGA